MTLGFHACLTKNITTLHQQRMGVAQLKTHPCDTSEMKRTLSNHHPTAAMKQSINQSIKPVMLCPAPLFWHLAVTSCRRAALLLLAGNDLCTTPPTKVQKCNQAIAVAFHSTWQLYAVRFFC